MKGIFLIIAIISSIFFRECGDHESLKPVEYVAWVEDMKNGLKVEKVIDDYIFSLQYKPLDYTVLKAERKPGVSEQELNKKVAEIADLQYFTFQISSKTGGGELLKSGINGKDEYEKRIQYFSSAMQNDIKLIDGKDTLPCVLFHFERTYNLTPYTNFDLGFEYGVEEKKARLAHLPIEYKSKTLLYNDHALNVRAVEVVVKNENLNKIPNLITQ
jgi:hypothetical protein